MKFIKHYLQILPKYQSTMPLFFHLLSNFQKHFHNKLYILSIFSNISVPFHVFSLIEGRPWTTLLNHEQHFNIKSLPKALKIHFHHLLPSIPSPFMNNQGNSRFHRSHCTCFWCCTWFRIGWLANFWLWANLIGLFECHISHY